MTTITTTPPEVLPAERLNGAARGRMMRLYWCETCDQHMLDLDRHGDSHQKSTVAVQILAVTHDRSGVELTLQHHAHDDSFSLDLDPSDQVKLHSGYRLARDSDRP